MFADDTRQLVLPEEQDALNFGIPVVGTHCPCCYRAGRRLPASTQWPTCRFGYDFPNKPQAAVGSAAMYGHIWCLRVAILGCGDPSSCGPAAMGHAAAHGHLGCLRLGHEMGLVWDATTLFWAAQCGHYDCLKYALEHGCPLSDRATLGAAADRHDDVRCMALAYESGCSWHPRTTAVALEHHNIKIARYLAQHGCPQ